MYLTALQILRNLFETSAGNKMALICLDTQILIWGIRKHAELGQEGNSPRAENLIEILTRSKDNIIIPSIVCAEACAAVPDDRIQSFMREMQRQFPIIPFDANAAYHYRTIYQTHKGNRQELTADGYKRPSMFADMKIVATALACRASSIYSEDPHLPKIANGFIEVKSMPPVPPKQLPLMPEAQIIQ